MPKKLGILAYRGHSRFQNGPPISVALKEGGSVYQTFERAGIPHGGDHLGHPGEAVGRSAEWRSGCIAAEVSRQGKDIGLCERAFYPARFPPFSAREILKKMRYPLLMRDSDVRVAVRTWLRAQYADDSRIVEEMGVWSGSVRIDLAVINGELHGFELKSERDTLARLADQAELYNQVFDRMTLVTAKRHLDKASSQIPSWWGITTAHFESTDSVALKLVKKAAYLLGLIPIFFEINRRKQRKCVLSRPNK
jgi:hypothetical protein